MRETPALIANERVKAISGIFYNLAAGLIAAAVASAYGDGFVGIVVLGWTLIAVVTIWVASQSLVPLQAED